MIPWSTDADKFNPNTIPESFIVKNQQIREYISTKDHDSNLFLIGAKGTGKTLLLRYKAHQYWDKLNVGGDSSIDSRSGSKELVESLQFTFVTLNKSELMLLAKSHNWVKIWTFAISLITLRKCRVDLTENLSEIDKDFPKEDTLSSIVSRIMCNPHSYINSKFFNYNIDLISLVANIRSNFVLFIDQLDQALNDLLNEEEYKYFDDEKGLNYPFLVWKNAQFGLLEYIYNTCKSANSHIKIYCTARNEALDNDSQLVPNIKGFSTILEYTYDELEKIFINNISLVDKDSLTDPKSKNPFIKLFGFDKMPHLHAIDQKRNNREEDVFGFIYRHSLGRPRDILVIGKNVFDGIINRVGYKRKSLIDKIEEVRRKVDDVAYMNILKDYFNEIVPKFKKEILELFINKVQKNVFIQSELDQIPEDVYNYLYRIGLLGYVDNGKQVFRRAAKHLYNYSIKLVKSDYYLLHPTTDGKFQESKKYNQFYDDYNIIGNGYEFSDSNLFSTNFLNNPLEDLLPKEVAGKNKSVEDINENLSIYVPLRDLYEEFFANSKSYVSVNDFLKTRFSQANEFLSRVSDLYILTCLQKRFPEYDWTEWEKQIKNAISTHQFNWEYATEIRGLSEKDLIHFGQRLVGRFLCLGLYCFLHLEPAVIQGFVKGNRLSLEVKPSFNDHALKYIRKAFFVKKLKPHGISFSNKSEQKLFSPEGREVLLSASNFEYKELNEWWAKYKNHDINLSKNFRTDHIKYIQENLF